MSAPLPNNYEQQRGASAGFLVIREKFTPVNPSRERHTGGRWHTLSAFKSVAKLWYVMDEFNGVRSVRGGVDSRHHSSTLFAVSCPHSAGG